MNMGDVQKVTPTSVKPLLGNEAPTQQSMGFKVFEQNRDGVMVKQVAKDCCRNAFGCQGATEYTMSGLDLQYMRSEKIWSEAQSKVPDSLYISEDSSCCCRCFWRDGRALTFNASTYNRSDPDGKGKGGTQVAKYEKELGCPLYFTITIPINQDGDTTTVSLPCCCLLPNLVTKDMDGRELNNSQYICDLCWCVPKIMYYEGGTPVYYLAPDTCCGGACIMCTTWGRGCYKVPFYFRDPNTKEKIQNRNGKNPQIAKVWAGVKKECCYTADTFATIFPDECDANRKAGLLGLTLLLDFTVFEKQGQADTTV